MSLRGGLESDEAISNLSGNHPVATSAKLQCSHNMKKLFLFLALLSTSSVLAQSAKVLICAPGNLNAAKVTDSSLRKFYHDKIDLADTLTDAVNNYEAVFLLSSGLFLTPTEQNLLRTYLTKSKSLYIENYNVGKVADSNSFWRFLGITGEGFDLLEREVTEVIGIKSTFAEGIDFRNLNWQHGLKPTFEGGFHLQGNVNPILHADCEASGLTIAHSIQTDSFKVVLHISIPASVVDYRDAFLSRVICDYFGLCTLSAPEKSSHQTVASMRVYPNPAKDFLNIQYDAPYLSPLNLDIVSSMGSVVANKYIDQNTNGIFTLSLTNGGVSALSSGTYILRLTSSKEVLSLPFYIK